MSDNNHEIVKEYLRGHHIFLDSSILTHNATQLKYDDTGDSIISASTVDGALEDLDTEINTLETGNVTITGNWTFSNTVSGVTPTSNSHFVIKEYADMLIGGLDWQESVLDKDVSDPSGLSPSDGDRYIVASGGTGDWSGQDDNIAEYNGTSWEFDTANEGFACWVEDEDINYVYNGSSWVRFASTLEHNYLSGLQGGTSSEYYHLTNSDYSDLTDANAQLSDLHTDGDPTFGSINLASGGDIKYNSNNFIRTDTTNYWTYIGYLAGNSQTQCTGIGYEALNTNTGSYVSVVGYEAGEENTKDNSTGVGIRAIWKNTGDSCTGVGSYACAENSGDDSTGIGYLALQYNSAVKCVGVGFRALRYNTGANCTALGYDSQQYGAGTSNNTFGISSGEFIVGGYCVAIGTYALQKNVEDFNIGIGQQTGRYMEGDKNVAIGGLAFTDFNEDAGNAKTFTSGDVDTDNERITITGHGFSASNNHINLKFTSTDTLPAGLSDGSIYQCEIIDANTLELKDANITDGGTGTHTVTPQYIYSNSVALGYNAQPDASNQVVLGDTNVTEVKSSGQFSSKSDNEGFATGSGLETRFYYNGTNAFFTCTSGQFFINVTAGDFYVTTPGEIYFRDADDSDAVLFELDTSNREMDVGTSSDSVDSTFYGSVVTSGVIKNQADSSGLYTGAGDDLRIYHDGTHSHINNSTGNLYFNTSVTLDFNSNYALFDLAEQFKIRDSDDANAVLFKLDTTNRVLEIGNSSDSVDSTFYGNVGIGTNSPASNVGISGHVLELSATNSSELVFDHTDAGANSGLGVISFTANDDHLAHIFSRTDGASDAAYISFHTQPTGGSYANTLSNERMRITSDGDVGIGTTSPDRILHVYQSTTDNIIALFESSDGRAFIELRDDSTSSQNVQFGADGNHLLLFAGGSEVITCKSSGNIGIGSTDPDTKLDINGAVTRRALSSDPSNPDNNSHVIWQSDGTGSGDDGDIMMKITDSGGTTKTVTLVDFSAA
ncbi:MAG: DUF2793 domain-containing protein [Candidatus Aenigmatarchaeota archaeon]